MAFSSGFSAGLQLGNNIKRNKLDREMLDWRKQQAANELAFNKGVADARAEAVGADLKLRQEDLADRKANTAADNARLDADSSWRRQSAIMGSLGSALGGARQNREYAAQIKALKAGGGAAAKPQAFRTVRREDPDTGEVTTERYPIAVPEQGEMAQTQPTAVETRMPKAHQARIDTLQNRIDEDRLAQAGGDNRYGFNLFSRQGRIDDSIAEIGRIRRMVDPEEPEAQQAPAGPVPNQPPPAPAAAGALAAPWAVNETSNFGAAQPRAPQPAPGGLPPEYEAEMTRRGMVKGPDGRWMKPTGAR